VLGLEQTEDLIGKLREEFSEAVRSDVREIAAAAARFPVHLARRAYSIDAIALSKSALGLSRLVYWSAAGASASENTRMVKDKVWRRLYEFANFTLAADLKNREITSEEHGKATEYLRQVFDAYNSVMKTMLEFEDLVTLKDADEAWSRILSHWRLKHE
jgi:hypothetical protein